MAASSASWASDPGVPGQDIWLTIDREVQRFADRAAGRGKRRLRRDGCTTGDVIALSSTPGFDPNWFNVGITARAVARR